MKTRWLPIVVRVYPAAWLPMVGRVHTATTGTEFGYIYSRTTYTNRERAQSAGLREFSHDDFNIFEIRDHAVVGVWRDGHLVNGDPDDCAKHTDALAWML